MATILSRSFTSNSNIDGYPVHADEASPDDADTSVSERVTKELVRWFKLLADETRLKILLYLLGRRELNVRALCDLLQLSQPAVSHHLALLRADGLIDCRRDGKHNYYHVLPERLSDLIGTVFSGMPGEEPEVRFGECVLTYRRQPGDSAPTQPS